MKVRISVKRNGITILASDVDVADAASFGSACANIWRALQEQKMKSATSIGALYESLDDSVLDDLEGVHIIIQRHHSSCEKTT